LFPISPHVLALGSFEGDPGTAVAMYLGRAIDSPFMPATDVQHGELIC
jgi:hypothetical protein